MNTYYKSLMGVPVRVIPENPKIPKIMLDPNFKWCSGAFRRKTNTRLIELFGYEEESVMLFNGECIMPKAMYVEFNRMVERDIANLFRVPNDRL